MATAAVFRYYLDTNNRNEMLCLDLKGLVGHGEECTPN